MLLVCISLMKVAYRISQGVTYVRCMKINTKNLFMQVLLELLNMTNIVVKELHTGGDVK